MCRAVKMLNDDNFCERTIEFVSLEICIEILPNPLVHVKNVDFSFMNSALFYVNFYSILSVCLMTRLQTENPFFFPIKSILL